MRKKKAVVTARICPKVHDVLLSISKREGKSLSQIVNEAIDSYIFSSEMQSEIRKAGKIMKEVEKELRKLNEELRDIYDILSDISSTLQTQKEWLKVSAFASFLAVEMLKTRLFHLKQLSQNEYKVYKQFMEDMHALADYRLEKLTGERVWEKKFHPLEVPEDSQKQKKGGDK